MAHDLTGKVVVVVGASKGYGLAASKELLRAGATVVMAARQGSDEEVADVPHDTGGARFHHVDVRDPASLQTLASDAYQQCGRIDAWVNTASIGVAGHFDKVPLQDQVDVIQTDLLGALFGSYTAIQHFREHGQQGVLINIAANPDSLDIPYFASYAAAKQGVVGLTRALRAEVRSEGWEDIHLCTVLPGDFAKLERSEVPKNGERMEPPKAQAAVLDDTADAIVSLITSPKNEVVIRGTHYFL